MKYLIANFLELLKTEGKSKCTIKAYRLDLKEFSEFFCDINVTAIRYSELISWINNLRSKGMSNNSCSRKIASIKSFFRYLIRMEIINKNPAETIKSPKIEKTMPIVISTDEVKEMLLYAKNSNESGVFWFRNYTIMQLLLNTGIRCEELTNISLDDINLKYNTILIHGKGAKQRIVYINDSLRPILSEYLLTYRIKLPKSHTSNFLFPSKKSSKISIGAVNNIVNHFFNSIGIKKSGISVHALRKRFATSIFENTGDIALTSKLLGHSSPTVTMRYVKINENTMRNATNCVNF